jgi:16S rRNA (guanine966-N2)-methyltransferase
MGIEALSRGAAFALFVDRAPGAVRVVRENLRRTHLEAAADVRRADATRAIRRPLGTFDLVLLDPPYDTEPPVLDEVLRNIAGQGVCAPGALVVLTRGGRSYTPVIPVHWRSISRLAYGDAVILVFQTP